MRNVQNDQSRIILSIVTTKKNTRHIHSAFWHFFIDLRFRAKQHIPVRL